MLDNHRLVKTPGFEIILSNIDDVNFYIENNMIFMRIKREDTWHTMLINIAREKEIDEDESNENILQ